MCNFNKNIQRGLWDLKNFQMKEEIKRVCEIKEVSHAAMQLCERENKNQIALMVYNQETEEIYTRLMQQIDAEKRVDKIKEILKKI